MERRRCFTINRFSRVPLSWTHGVFSNKKHPGKPLAFSLALSLLYRDRRRPSCVHPSAAPVVAVNSSS